MKPLNKMQQEVYDFIAGHIDEKGESPTGKVIQERFNLASRDTAFRRTDVLVQKGWLIRKNRKLVLVDDKNEDEIRIGCERYKIGLHGFVFRWADGWFKSERSVAEIKKAQRASLRCV
jgi:SOS-response transcriptional repressor LexA